MPEKTFENIFARFDGFVSGTVGAYLTMKIVGYLERPWSYVLFMMLLTPILYSIVYFPLCLYLNQWLENIGSIHKEKDHEQE